MDRRGYWVIRLAGLPFSRAIEFEGVRAVGCHIFWHRGRGQRVVVRGTFDCSAPGRGVEAVMSPHLAAVTFEGVL